MKPQDHSDTTLLVWSDWLEENGEEQRAHDLREEIANPPAKRWDYDYYWSNAADVGAIGLHGVGGAGTSNYGISGAGMVVGGDGGIDGVDGGDVGGGTHNYFGIPVGGNRGDCVGDEKE